MIIQKVLEYKNLLAKFGTPAHPAWVTSEIFYFLWGQGWADRSPYLPLFSERDEIILSNCGSSVDLASISMKIIQDYPSIKSNANQVEDMKSIFHKLMRKLFRIESTRFICNSIFTITPKHEIVMNPNFSKMSILSRP